MPWQSAPYIGQQVYNSNNEQGVITDLLNFELIPIPINDDFISNWLNELSPTFHVIVNWSNEKATCVPLNYVFPVTNSSPAPEPLITDSNNEVLYNWDWVIPFVESQRVVLNPNHPDFDSYNKQAADTIGTVINVDNIINVINSWEPTAINLSAYIDVEWDCGHVNCYPINSLLPVTPVITNNLSNKTFHIGEKITFSPSYHFNDYIRRELNDNFNAYVVNVNPRTVDVMFEANANQLFTFNKAILNTDDTEPIKKITKYRLNDSDTFYTIDGIINPYLDFLIFKRGFTVASAKVLN